MNCRSPLAQQLGRWLAPLLLTLSSGPLFADSANLQGDADRGRAVYEDPDRGHCALCHQLPALEIAFAGNIGPSLEHVGDRLSAAQLRRRIINPQAQNPESIMPAYHRTTALLQVQQQFRGKPILTRQEIEDLVALLTLQRSPASDQPPSQ